MDKIKITVEVNGKIVPLDTISTETFEKVKEAARKPKYEGVYTSVQNSGNYPRVFFVVTDEICRHKGRAVALNEIGNVMYNKSTFEEFFANNVYENLKKLGDE